MVWTCEFYELCGWREFEGSARWIPVEVERGTLGLAVVWADLAG